MCFYGSIYFNMYSDDIIDICLMGSAEQNRTKLNMNKI